MESPTIPARVYEVLDYALALRYPELMARGHQNMAGSGMTATLMDIFEDQLCNWVFRRDDYWMLGKVTHVISQPSAQKKEAIFDEWTEYTQSGFSRKT